MALWQYQFTLVPKDACVELLQQYVNKSPGVSSSRLWSNASLPNDYKTLLEDVLPLDKGWWDDSAELWGFEDGNRVIIGHSHGQVKYIVCRLDLRQLDLNVVSALVLFAQHVSCLLVTTNARVLEPDIHLLLEEIRSSSAQRFVISPTVYFDEISRASRAN